MDATVPVFGSRAACGHGTDARHGPGIGQSAVEHWQDAVVGRRVCQLRVGRGTKGLGAAAQSRRCGMRIDCRTVGPRPGHRVRRVRRPRGGRRGGERGGQQRGPRFAGPEPGVRHAQRQAEREWRASAAGHRRDRLAGTSDHVY